MIKIYDPGIKDSFSSGEAVFIISKNDTKIGIVTTYTDYLKKIKSHLYNPLLFQVSFTTRLAYLYGCLNHSFEEPQKSTYTFLWRKIGSQEWKVWFEVIPEKDEI